MNKIPKKNGIEIIKAYQAKIKNLNLSEKEKTEVLSVFEDYSKALSSHMSGYNIEYTISGHIEALFDHYRLIANNLSDLFFVLDTSLNFTFIAPTIENILEYKYQELIGKSFDELVPEWSGNTLGGKIETIRNDRPDIENPHKFSIQLSSKYGQLKWYEVQITSIYDEENSLIGYNGVCRDIKERLKYEEALQRAKIKAEESDKLKSAFLANMSHEIRTPLNGIIGFSTMLNNRRLPEEKREKYTDFILSSSKQLLTIINDIIDISKIEAKQLTFLERKIDLHEVLNEVFALAEIETERMGKKGDIDVEMKFGQKNTLYLNIDDIRLKQVLINLITNALKFTDVGKINIGYEFKTKDYIRFYVKDTGIGIPKNIQKSVFNRFSQGKVDSQTKISGTGLGLAICKGIVKNFAGQIGVISEEGVGSEFFVTIPYKKYKYNHEEE